MSDNKMTISRSYTRKINLGNYESEDFFSSRGLEVPIDTDIETQKEISVDLFTLAMTDVERSIRKMKEIRDKETGVISPEKLKEMLDNVSNGRPILVEDFEKLDAVQGGKIQDAKRKYKRDKYQEAKNGKQGKVESA
jgi:hypothetical protein